MGGTVLARGLRDLDFTLRFGMAFQDDFVKIFSRLKTLKG